MRWRRRTKGKGKRLPGPRRSSRFQYYYCYRQYCCRQTRHHCAHWLPAEATCGAPAVGSAHHRKYYCRGWPSARAQCGSLSRSAGRIPAVAAPPPAPFGCCFRFRSRHAASVFVAASAGRARPQTGPACEGPECLVAGDPRSISNQERMNPKRYYSEMNIETFFVTGYIVVLYPHPVTRYPVQ